MDEILSDMNIKMNELEIKLKMKEEENKNLISMINSQKIAHEALLRTPQNQNYSLLKKNYEMEQQANRSLSNKLK